MPQKEKEQWNQMKKEKDKKKKKMKTFNNHRKCHEKRTQNKTFDEIPLLKIISKNLEVIILYFLIFMMNY